MTKMINFIHIELTLKIFSIFPQITWRYQTYTRSFMLTEKSPPEIDYEKLICAGNSRPHGKQHLATCFADGFVSTHKAAVDWDAGKLSRNYHYFSIQHFRRRLSNAAVSTCTRIKFSDRNCHYYPKTVIRTF